MALNIPTVILHLPLHNFFRDCVVKDIEILVNANILFTDPAAAANHINKYYSNIDEWWLSESTQTAVKVFVDKYAYSDKNWKLVWLNNFLN
jgi:putative transferase (TIGR04331 family)